MATTKKTTIKPISLGYREVGATTGDYTPCMGVLKGLAIAQDDPDETSIDAEFYDAAFDIYYKGKPIKATFELVNYKLEDLPPLFGGTYSAASATDDELYVAAPTAFTSEHEWKISFQKGNQALIIYRGLTMGAIKKDEDGALAYSVTVTGLTADAGTDAITDDKMYGIVGDAKTGA